MGGAQRKSRAKPILDQLASGSISVEEAQRLLDEAKADKVRPDNLESGLPQRLEKANPSADFARLTL